MTTNVIVSRRMARRIAQTIIASAKKKGAAATLVNLDAGPLKWLPALDAAVAEEIRRYKNSTKTRFTL